MKQKLKILAIDSEEIILKSIRKALKSNPDFDYIISTCNTALDGLKLIRSDTFDLVFIDLVMPGMNGNEVLRRIKNIYPAVSAIFMSGFSFAGNYHSTNGKGNSINETLNNAEGFLLKPFTLEEIRSLVSRVLNNKAESKK